MTPVSSSHYARAALYSVFAYFIIALGIMAWKGVIATYSIAQILALEALVCVPLFMILAKIRAQLETS